MLLPQTSRPSCRATSLSYPLRATLSNRPAGIFGPGNSPMTAVHWSGNLIVSPEAAALKALTSDGGGSPLEGGETLGLSASLWGEQ